MGPIVKLPPVLTLQDLSLVLGRSPETIRKDLRRNPKAVPPRLVLPNTRQLRWRLQDVGVWLEQHVSSAAEGADHA